MRFEPVTALLVDRDIAKRYSRPQDSDDDPYSETQFKTFEAGLTFRRASAASTTPPAHCRAFFVWYSTVHRHAGVGYMSLYRSCHGQAEQLCSVHQGAHDAAFCATANRFRERHPKLRVLPTAE